MAEGKHCRLFFSYTVSLSFLRYNFNFQLYSHLIPTKKNLKFYLVSNVHNVAFSCISLLILPNSMKTEQT